MVFLGQEGKGGGCGVVSNWFSLQISGRFEGSWIIMDESPFIYYFGHALPPIFNFKAAPIFSRVARLVEELCRNGR